MASGVAVNDDIVLKYQELKLGHQYRYLIFALNDKFTEIVLEKSGGPNATYEEFKNSMPANDCRYGIFDLEFTAEDGGQRNKIVFILWAPDSAKIKAKMLLTSSKAGLKAKLVGLATEVQATDAAELDFEAVKTRAMK